MSSHNVLEITEVSIRFGGVTAVNDLSMQVGEGSIVGLIGPNGAGKTTAFNIISGFYTPNEGTVLFNGQNITGLPPYRVCRAGLSRTFQNIRLFTTETALENVMVGGHVRQKYPWWCAPLMWPPYLKEEKLLRASAYDLLRVLHLEEYAHVQSSSMPYGAQRRLEIARALATKPSFLLLDEPAAGMNPQESAELMQLIEYIRREFKLTILLIEHDMKVVMGVCEYLYVLDYGSLIASGRPEEIRENPKVIEAYLGEDYLHHA